MTRSRRTRINLYHEFFRCSFAISFLGDLLLDGINVAWIVHLPIMLHIAVLGKGRFEVRVTVCGVHSLIGLDSQRPSVFHHCRKLLENLLVVFACHNDHCSVARLLLEKKSVLPSRRYLLDQHSRRSVESLCSSPYMGDLQQSSDSLDSAFTLVESEASELKSDVNSISDVEAMVMS